MAQKITGQMAHKFFEYNCVMTKKEKEQLKLNNLLQECIGEQLKIGLHPADNISIYIYKDPETGVVCPKEATGYSALYKNSAKKIILIKRNCFEKYPDSELKCLIHSVSRYFAHTTSFFRKIKKDFVCKNHKCFNIQSLPMA